MNIVITDKHDNTIYTKYSLPNLEHESVYIEDDNVIIIVSKGQNFPKQEDFNKAGMR